MVFERINALRDMDREQLENVARALGLTKDGPEVFGKPQDGLRLACIDAIVDQELRDQRIEVEVLDAEVAESQAGKWPRDQATGEGRR